MLSNHYQNFISSARCSFCTLNKRNSSIAVFHLFLGLLYVIFATICLMLLHFEFKSQSHFSSCGYRTSRLWLINVHVVLLLIFQCGWTDFEQTVQAAEHLESGKYSVPYMIYSTGKYTSTVNTPHQHTSRSIGTPGGRQECNMQ